MSARLEQVQLVVVAQRADAQPGEPGEASDRQQIVIHGYSDPSATFCSAVRAGRSEASWKTKPTR